jgi:hypothetical protein
LNLGDRYHQFAESDHGRCQGVPDGSQPGDPATERVSRRLGTVTLKRTDEGFLVITKDPWEIFFEGVEQLSDKFLGSDRVQPELESRD